MSLLAHAGLSEEKIASVPEEITPIKLRAYRISGKDPEEGACIAYARTAHVAKVVAWRSGARDWLIECCDGDWINVSAKWIHGGADWHRVPEKEAAGEAYVVEAPTICVRCERWHVDGLEKTTGLCWSCFEDDASFVE